ncbi:MAG: hypothetical protein WBV78_11295 [Roseobacter sp.]
MTWLRLFVIASAFVAIAYDTIWLKDPVGVFWESLLATGNIAQIAREWLIEQRATFREEETQFLAARLSSLSKAEARRFLNMGAWIDGPTGAVLTTVNEDVDLLVYLVKGRVDIYLNDKLVGACGPGNFVVEMSVLGHRDCRRTVTLLDDPIAPVARPANQWRRAGRRGRDWHCA